NRPSVRNWHTGMVLLLPRLRAAAAVHSRSAPFAPPLLHSVLPSPTFSAPRTLSRHLSYCRRLTPSYPSPSLSALPVDFAMA
ncbi:hypothetical protein B0H16DRAFT_1585433, partial [Mycena metata]